MKKSFELQAGIFVVVALVVLGLTIFVLGNDRQIFSRQVPYKAAFKDVAGLNDGAPVRIGGITVGRVDKIAFSKELGDPRVIVTFLITKKYTSHICAGSEASIQTQGLLGDKYLTLSSSTTGVDPLPAGSMIASREPADIGEALEKAQIAIANTVEISKAAFEVVSEIRSETVKELTRSLKNFGDVAEQVKTGQGLFHELVYGKATGTTDQVKEILSKLNASANNLKAASEALSKGQGTLGALLVDSSLYDNMVQITDGAKRSAILRAAINSAIKKNKEEAR